MGLLGGGCDGFCAAWFGDFENRAGCGLLFFATPRLQMIGRLRGRSVDGAARVAARRLAAGRAAARDSIMTAAPFRFGRLC